jgi:hypothetical protein
MINDINELMQRHRVFCVTTHKDSEKMWSGYADHHEGIALRVEASPSKESKFDLFRPVTYREKRPTIYRDAVHFLTSNLFDDQEASSQASASIAQHLNSQNREIATSWLLKNMSPQIGVALMAGET